MPHEKALNEQSVNSLFTLRIRDPPTWALVPSSRLARRTGPGNGYPEHWPSTPTIFTLNIMPPASIRMLGEIEQAFDLLERLLPHAGHELKQGWIKHDSDLDPLRSHPRYQKILELIG